MNHADQFQLEAFRALIANPATRREALLAIERTVKSAESPQREKVILLGKVNYDEIGRSIDALDPTSYDFDLITGDDREAHRKVADIQRILYALGYELGAGGVDGYTGGPPGKPVVIEAGECQKLAELTPSTQKILAGQEGETESWTRDATRRLQAFLGTYGLRPTSEFRIRCIRFTDGLFGRVTLSALSEFMTEAR